MITAEEASAAGAKINSSMATNRSVAPPNHGVNLVGGGTVSLGSLGELGVTGAVTYSRRFTIVPSMVIRRFNYDPLPNEPDRPFPYKATVNSGGEIGNDQVSWGGLAVLAWSPSDDHRFTLTGLTSRSSDNEARSLLGPNDNGDVVEDTRLRFVSRGLFFGELLGEHKIKALRGMELDYRISGSLATLDEPDTRQTSYLVTLDEGGAVASRFWDGTPSLSGQHFYGAQADRSIGGSLNILQPVLEGKAPLKAKGGFLFQLRERSFEARRFHFRPVGGQFAAYSAPPDEVFSDENLAANKVEFEEWTQSTDTFFVSQSLYAGYLMADYQPLSWLRLIGGARLEAWAQHLRSYDRFLPDVKVTSTLSTFEPLPALSAVFKTTKDSNLRVSLSRTVARPQLRETAPFLFTDYVGARDQQGNPDLRSSQVYNADVRFEVFPGAADVVAVSAFFKRFEDPIEAILLGGSSNDLITYRNARGARVLGLELEVKKGLGFLSPALADLSPLANLTLASSRVDLDPAEGTQTSNTRALVGQSPLVLNLGLDYSYESTGTRARVVYNVSAPRIQAAGSNHLPDTYEQPRHLLDASVAQRIGSHLDLKLTVENILQAAYRVTFGPDNKDEAVVDQRPLGTSFNLSATITN